MEENKLLMYAKKELELAGLLGKDVSDDGRIANAVLELLELFSKQNHNEMSAYLVVNIFRELMLYHPLTPLTGMDDEWLDNGVVYQNKRDSRVFKEKDTGRVYFTEAILWQNEGKIFTGTVEGISSSQYVRKFPFVPQMFLVMADESRKIKKHIINIEVLKLIAQYYDAPEVEKYLSENKYNNSIVGNTNE